MQDLTSSQCTTASATEVYDKRDGTIYNIQRLKDGKCWLLDNLAIDLMDADVQSRLNSSTTNASDSDINYLINGGGTISDQYATASISNDISTASYSATRIYTAVKDELVSYAALMDDTDAIKGKRGGYYNYCAASAGTYCYGNGTDSGSATGDATADICPAGWRMPTGNTTGEFQTLYDKYDNITDLSIALRITLAGRPTTFATNFSIWSSTHGNLSTSHVYMMNGTTHGINPSIYDERGLAISVRCILRDVSSASYLQDVTWDMVDRMSVGDTATLRDSRDDHPYTVGKLADGNLWLLDNLALDLTDTTVQSKLTSATTNATDSDLSYLINGGGTSPYSQGAVTNTWSYWAIKPVINTDSKDTDVIYAAGVSGSGKVGVYYNYCAASAGTYCYPSNTPSDDIGVDATADICPANWRLPTGGATGEYQSLYEAYDKSTTDYVAALHATLSGINNGVHQNTAGYFWTPTLSSALANMMVMSPGTGQSIGIAGASASRTNAPTIRCIFKSATEQALGIRYMQDVTAENHDTVLATMEDKQPYTLIDYRDGNDYTVKKINGQLWMTQNLRFTGTTLYSATSNVDATYTKDSPLTLTYSDLADPTNKAEDGPCWGDYISGSGVPSTGSGGGYINPCIKDSGDTSIGVYYNYAAASAGTITGNSNSTIATSSVCPAGWTLPTAPGTVVGTDLNILAGNAIPESQDATPSLAAFGDPIVHAGAYRNGVLSGLTADHTGGACDWWAASATTSTNRGRLTSEWFGTTFRTNGGLERQYGVNIRCISRPTS